MSKDSSISKKKEGKLLVAYSNDDGSSLGVEFSSTTEVEATAIFRVCASSLGEGSRRLVSSSTVSDTEISIPGGGDDMEKRLAVLEIEVSHIKGDVSEIKKSVSAVEKTVNSVDKSMAVLMVKLDNITDSLSQKPSSDAVDKKISDAKLAILLGVPAIIGIATAIIKVIQHYYFPS